MNDKPVQKYTSPELARLIRSLGRISFASDCLSFINLAIKADHLALFRFDATLKPELIGGASPPDKNIVTATGRQYIRSFYMSDPNIHYISRHQHEQQEAEQTPVMVRLKASEISNPEYREQIYQRKGLLDRISWIGQSGTHWYCSNLYRDSASGYYDEQELKALQAMGVLLGALFEQHLLRLNSQALEIQTAPAVSRLENLVSELRHGLTDREIAVCARALSGMTRVGIGLDLDIKPTTVATLTQRAYAKLNICSLNELFALCLQAASYTGDPSG